MGYTYFGVQDFRRELANLGERRKRRRSTKGYTEKTDSNSPTRPNEAVRVATLLL